MHRLCLNTVDFIKTCQSEKPSRFFFNCFPRQMAKQNIICSLLENPTTIMFFFMSGSGIPTLVLYSTYVELVTPRSPTLPHRGPSRTFKIETKRILIILLNVLLYLLKIAAIIIPTERCFIGAFIQFKGYGTVFTYK